MKFQFHFLAWLYGSSLSLVLGRPNLCQSFLPESWLPAPMSHPLPCHLTLTLVSPAPIPPPAFFSSWIPACFPLSWVLQEHLTTGVQVSPSLLALLPVFPAHAVPCTWSHFSKCQSGLVRILLSHMPDKLPTPQHDPFPTSPTLVSASSVPARLLSWLFLKRTMFTLKSMSSHIQVPSP